MAANGDSAVKDITNGVDAISLDVSKLTPLSPEVISRQATINIGTIGHVAHGKSTVVKAISGVQTVRFKNELVRNITIKLGYANAKVCKNVHAGDGMTEMVCGSRFTNAKKNRAPVLSVTGLTPQTRKTTLPVKFQGAEGR